MLKVGRDFLAAGLLLSVVGMTVGCLFSAHRADFPWIVRIMVRKTSAQLCVGNLVSEHFIMSPVTCFRRWSTLPKDYYSAKDLMVIAGRDDGTQNSCSQERPGILVTAHSNYSRDPHPNNVAILEVEPFDFDDKDMPYIPFLQTGNESTEAIKKLQTDKPICYVPTFNNTKYLRNQVADKESMRAQIVDGDECWSKYCPRGHKACLPFFNKDWYICAQFVKPEKRCGRHDVGAPLVCDDVAIGYMKLCRENRPMLFQAFNDNILDSAIRYRNMSVKLKEYEATAKKNRFRY